MPLRPCRNPPATRRADGCNGAEKSSSKRGSDLKLEFLDSIARELAYRVGQRKSQRSHRGYPAQADTHRGPHQAEIHTFGLAVHIAGVDESEPTQRAVVASTRKRSDELDVQHHVASTTDIDSF